MCMLSGCGNLWGDKDFWYIIVCHVYVDSIFVSGGGVDPQACDGRGCLLIVLVFFRSASLSGVSLFI